MRAGTLANSGLEAKAVRLSTASMSGPVAARQRSRFSGLKAPSRACSEASRAWLRGANANQHKLGGHKGSVCFRKQLKEFSKTNKLTQTRPGKAVLASGSRKKPFLCFS